MAASVESQGPAQSEPQEFEAMEPVDGFGSEEVEEAPSRGSSSPPSGDFHSSGGSDRFEPQTWEDAQESPVWQSPSPGAGYTPYSGDGSESPSDFVDEDQSPNPGAGYTPYSGDGSESPSDFVDEDQSPSPGAGYTPYSGDGSESPSDFVDEDQSPSPGAGYAPYSGDGSESPSDFVDEDQSPSPGAGYTPYSGDGSESPSGFVDEDQSPSPGAGYAPYSGDGSESPSDFVDEDQSPNPGAGYTPYSGDGSESPSDFVDEDQSPSPGAGYTPYSGDGSESPSDFVDEDQSPKFATMGTADAHVPDEAGLAEVSSPRPAYSPDPVDASSTEASPAEGDGAISREPQLTSASVELPGAASRHPRSPDDRIRALFQRRQAAAEVSDVSKESFAATSTLEEADVGPAVESQSLPRSAPPSEADRPRSPRDWMSRLFRRKATKELVTTDSPGPSIPDVSQPELLPWEPRGLRYKIGQLFRRQQVTVSVDKDVVRVVVFKGREVLAWGTVQLDQIATAEGEAAQEGGVAESLRALLRNLGIRRGRMVTDVPFHVPLMRHFHLPPMRRRHVEQVVVSEVLETVPFSVAEMDLSWQTRSNGAGNEVFAVAMSNQAIDDHVQLLSDAGVRAKATFSKAVAVAHAAHVPNAIIAHVEPSRAAFVLVYGWAPQAVYEIDLRDKYPTPRERAEAISKAVEEVAGYGQGLDLADSVPHVLPVVLTGEVPSDGPLAQEIYQVLRREVLPLTPPLVYPEHFPPGEYAANVGLALAEESRSRARSKIPAKGIPTINVLPARHLPRRLPVRHAAVFLGLMLLVAVAVNVGERVDGVSAEVAVVSDRLTRLQAQERQQRLLSGRAQSIEAQIRVIGGLAQNLEADLTRFDSELKVTLERLETLTGSALPPNVTLSSFVQQAGGYGIGGTAPSYEDALQYMKNLRASGLFRDAKILQASQADLDLEQAAPEQLLSAVSFQGKVELQSGESGD